MVLRWLSAVAMSVVLAASAGDAKPDLRYTADGKMEFPEHYREWVFLTSGMDMSYNPPEGAADMHMFDNVFVTPESYREFVKSGTWPDRSVFVLEFRGAESGVSINKRGLTQTAGSMGFEVHVKDAKLPGGWGFFEFDDDHSAPATVVDRKASCYSCHEGHAASDTTFVQFYPTLLPVAKAKGTLSAAYLKESTKP